MIDRTFKSETRVGLRLSNPSDELEIIEALDGKRRLYDKYVCDMDKNLLLVTFNSYWDLRREFSGKIDLGDIREVDIISGKEETLFEYDVVGPKFGCSHLVRVDPKIGKIYTSSGESNIFSPNSIFETDFSISPEQIDHLIYKQIEYGGVIFGLMVALGRGFFDRFPKIKPWIVDSLKKWMKIHNTGYEG